MRASQVIQSLLGIDTVRIILNEFVECLYALVVAVGKAGSLRQTIECIIGITLYVILLCSIEFALIEVTVSYTAICIGQKVIFALRSLFYKLFECIQSLIVRFLFKVCVSDAVHCIRVVSTVYLVGLLVAAARFGIFVVAEQSLASPEECGTKSFLVERAIEPGCQFY